VTLPAVSCCQKRAASGRPHHGWARGPGRSGCRGHYSRVLLESPTPGRHDHEPGGAHGHTGCRAIQLKLQGLSYQQIADELGYTSRGTVYKIINTAQATQLTGAVEEHLDTEVSRLNALQAAVWPAAIAGDLQALTVAARLIEARCRLLGLIGSATKRTAGALAG